MIPINNIINKIKSYFSLTKKDLTLLAIVSTSVFVFDFITKYAVFSMDVSGYYICSILNILKVRNYGISFGLFSENPYIMIYFIIIFDLAVMIYLLHCFQSKNMYKRPTLFAVAVCFVFGGAVGNLFDRIYYGSVRDFIDFHWNNHHWPCFNIADIFICVGVGIFIVCEIFLKKTKNDK